MKTLVVCPTYGRIPYLNRMVASFLSQTYDDKHLVIVNDDKNVELCCENKQVTCINLNKKILLPQKRNIGTVVGYHDIIMQYDDDDIMLPQRISNHVKKHIEYPDAWYYWNKSSYIVYGDKFELAGCSPNHSSFLRKGWFDVGGYENNKNIGDDMEFFYKIPDIYKKEEDNPLLADYVYNFGGVNYHTSYEKDSRIDEIAYNQLLKMNLIGKKYWIEPNYEEFNKFLKLETIYNEKKESLIIKHIRQGEIYIDHLFV